MANKTPTIQDVARFAKVSTATVSRALSSPERVSESTRARVSEAVNATGFTLNQAARSLRQRTSKTILVGLPDMRNIFFSSILDAIEREAALRGYGVLVCNRYSGANPVHQLGEYFRSHRADGLLLLDGSLALEQLLELTREPTALPLVVACEEIPDAPFHTVKTDNPRAAACATRHLLGLGHTRIGHISGPAGNVLRRERLQGFMQAMDEAALTVLPEWVFPGDFQMESGYAAALQYLALPNPPSAVFAANDEMAIGFLSGLREQGLECPRDISVVGFDDLAIALHYWPPLTTVRQPREKLGQMAAATLIDILEGSSRTEPLRIVLTSEMIIRASTAPYCPSPLG
ncbi:MAG TPA: LacI family DNA-binding transcriptional regulator [Devosia sp.]|nr:LacI family DNA-binding transcriptional regulator [Devosia sp.]